MFHLCVCVCVTLDDACVCQGPTTPSRLASRVRPHACIPTEVINSRRLRPGVLPIHVYIVSHHVAWIVPPFVSTHRILPESGSQCFVTMLRVLLCSARL